MRIIFRKPLFLSLASFLLNATSAIAAQQKERPKPAVDCEAHLALFVSDALDDGGDFAQIAARKITHNELFAHGYHSKKFYAWALDIDAASVDVNAAASVQGMLKASESDFDKYFGSYLEVTQKQFREIAQAYLDRLTEADLEFAPNHRPGAAIAFDSNKLKLVDEEVFGDWDNSGKPRAVNNVATARKPAVRSPYNFHVPDPSSAKALLNQAADLISVSPTEKIKWKADSQVPYPVVDDIAEPIVQKIKIGEVEVDVNQIRTFAEKEDYMRVDSGTAQFLEVLSLDGEDKLHLRYEYLGIGEQLEGHDSISNNAILKEVWIKLESGAWQNVIEHVGTRARKYLYKSPRSIRVGDIEVNFIPLKDL